MNSSFIPILLTALGILFLLDLYVFGGIKPLLEGINSDSVKVGIRVGFWILAAIKMGLVLFAASKFPAKDIADYQTGSLLLSYAMLFVVPELIFAIILFAGDLFRFIDALVSLLPSISSEGESFLPSRRRFFSQAGIVVASVPFVGMLYGILKGKYDFKVHEITLKFPDLPKTFHGFTLTQISDIHSGSFDSPEAVQRGVNLINEQGSDIIVFTGDLVNNYATEVEPWIDTFAQLKARNGVYSITGNHDYGDYAPMTPNERAENFQRLMENHKRMGFRLLMNEHVKFEREGEQISLLGIENWGLPPFPQHGDLNQALQDSSDFKILLSHDPSHWDAQVLPHQEKIHLTLSGHTHGMQFGIEIPGIKWSPVKYRYPRWAGLYEKAQQFLYVNRGFGFIGFSGRVGIWPEITVIRLEQA